MPDTTLRPTLRVVLVGIANGRTAADIGRSLGRSEAAIKDRTRRLYEELGVHDRAHAVAVAWRTGLIGPADIRPVAAAPHTDSPRQLLDDIRSRVTAPQCCWVVLAGHLGLLVLPRMDGTLTAARRVHRASVDSLAGSGLIRVGELTTIPSYSGGPGLGPWAWRTDRMARTVQLTRAGVAAA